MLELTAPASRLSMTHKLSRRKLLNERWWLSFQAVDAIISMQAVHEVRDAARIAQYIMNCLANGAGRNN